MCLILVFPSRALYARGGSSVTRGGVFVENDEGKPIRVYEASYALVIGASAYKHWRKLPGVKQDVKEVVDTLEKHGFGVTVVTDPNREALYRAFNDFIGKYGRHPSHRLLFYYAGHGHTEKLAYGRDMGYLVPIDSPDPRSSLDEFKSTAMDMKQIEVFARQVESRHALFIFDSCFSGSVFALGPSRSLPLHLRDRASKAVRMFITSGSASETVPDQSIFREQLVAALAGQADLSRDGYVTGEELGVFLQDQVIRYSEDRQHPQFGYIRDDFLDKGEMLFDLGTRPPPPVSPPATAQASAPPIPKATLVLTTRPAQASFQIDGRGIEVAQGEPLVLPAGKHKVGFVSTLKKRLVRPVDLEPDGSLFCRAMFLNDRVDCQAHPFPPPASRLGVALTTTFGVSTLTFAGIYGQAYLEGERAVDIPVEEAEQILQRVRMGRIGAAASAAATLTSAIVTWVSRPSPGATHKPASPLQLGLAAGPSLERLAAEGVHFPNAMSSSSWTGPAVISMLTGLYPAVFGLEGLYAIGPPLPIGAKHPHLFAELRAQGWATWAYQTNPVLKDAGVMRGFDECDYAFDAPAGRVTAKVIDWLSRHRDGPFAAYVHYLDPHVPYLRHLDGESGGQSPAAAGLEQGGREQAFGAGPAAHPHGPGGPRKPPEVLAGSQRGRGEVEAWARGPEQRAEVRALYQGEIAFVDQQLGVLVEWLASSGLLDTTAVVVISDHGEELWEHGGYEHGHSLHREVSDALLIVRPPASRSVRGPDATEAATARAGAVESTVRPGAAEGTIRGRVVRDPVSPVDLRPTVLSLLGMPVAPPCQGQDLLRPLDPDRLVMSSGTLYDRTLRSVASRRWHLIDGEGPPRLYDRKQDPMERKDLATARGDVVRQLLEARADHEADAARLRLELAAPGGPSAGGPAAPATVEQLRALGYVQ